MMISQQDNFQKTNYITQPKLLFTPIAGGYFNTTVPDPGFISPYSQGKKNENYVSPTFTSGDWYNPQKGRNEQPSVSPIRDNSKSPLPSTPQKLHEALEEQYLKARMPKMLQKYEGYTDETQTKKVSLASIQQTSPLVTQRQSQLKAESPDRRSKTPTVISKELNKFFNEGKSPTGRNQTQPYNNDDEIPISIRLGVKTPLSNYFKINNQNDQFDRQTEKSFKFCPECYNKEMIANKCKQKHQQKELEQDLIVKNIKEEQRKIQQEATELLQRREQEQQMRKKGYQDHLDKQNRQKEQKNQIYRLEKDQETQSMHKYNNDDSRSNERYNKKRNDFIDGLKTQLKEKNKQKQIEQAIINEQNKLPTSLQVGQEHIYGFENQMNMKKQIDNILMQNQNSIAQKNQAKQQERTREKFYSDWMKSQNEKHILQQTQEKQIENLKKELLIYDLDQQVYEKKKKKQIEIQRDRDFYNQMRQLEAINESNNQRKHEHCNECNKSVPKDYLSKIIKKEKEKKKI